MRDGIAASERADDGARDERALRDYAMPPGRESDASARDER